jgi:hypothetical protein
MFVTNVPCLHFRHLPFNIARLVCILGSVQGLMGVSKKLAAVARPDVVVGSASSPNVEPASML